MGSLLAELFLLLISATQVHAASFYGDSYIHLRTAEASVQTSLHLHFRTSSQAGLLFLAVGSRDFLLLELTSGHVQVRLDLGSGQHWLCSDKSIHLGDLAWHSVELSHRLHNLTMTVDRSSFSSLRMPGPDVELSIQSLFVGGAAGLKEPDSLQNVSSGFRGCVERVVFNQHNLMSGLGPSPGDRSVHEVSLGCSLQFSATEEDAVGFFSSKAFVALPSWEVPQEGAFECEMHPSATADDGVILFTSDKHARFVTIAIRDGHVVATVAHGEGNKTELRSLTYVHANNTWYNIQLHLLPSSIQLKVGEELIKAHLDAALRFHPRGSLFLGGLDEEARGEAGRAGLMSEGHLPAAGGSFEGCLRGIRVNGRRTGLPQAAVTKDVSVGCQKSQDPDPQSVTDPTEPPEVAVSSTLPHHSKRNVNFLSLRTLEVSEGGRAPLEPRHIKVNLDFQKLDLRPAQLMFRVEEPPVHGELRLDLRPDTGAALTEERTVVLGADELERTFSMLDLWQGRVLYVHSGAELLQDSFMFSVFSANKRQLPVFLNGNHLHRLDINVTPVNDAPVLTLPEGNLFTVVDKSKRKLTTDVLRVADPDSSPAELIFSSLGNSSEGGHLENQDSPSRTIHTFSLSDLEEGKISFVHTGVSSSRLAFRVSDGSKMSNTVVLRIMALPLEHQLVNNTGLEVNQGGASIITTNHLAVQVNVAEQAVEIQYDLTELPRYGELQQLHAGGDWKPTTSFSQKLLEKERVRYANTYRGLQLQNVTDGFKFKISMDSVSTDEAVFLIAVRWIHFKVTRSKMEMSGTQAVTVSPEDLHVVSKGVKLNESDLHFRILAAPKKGRLFLHSRTLQRNSTFSQKDIGDGALRYELLRGVHDDTRDIVSFQVFSEHANSTPHDFRINIRADPPAVAVINKGLSVPEGGSKVINKDLLFAHTGSEREVQYNITVRPRHGWMRRIHLSNSTSINDNIATFTNQDIVAERIMYVHDDSENKEDSFTFQILLHKHKHGGRKENGSPAQHTFNISVLLVNDQRPTRVVDKVFHVARDGQRLLTLEDLCYRDDDSDFEDSWLVYTRRGIPMGELVLASNTSHKLYEFTQQDLEKKKVLFVHRGVSFGRFVLFVSDGKHYVSALLEVMAQDPYLQAENNTGLMVQRGGVSNVTSAHLGVFTNLDIRDPQEVTFEVFIPPKHGTLCFNHGDGATAAGAVIVFTQRDLAEGRLAYRHDGGDKLSDVFNVTARAREQSTDRRLVRGRRAVHLDIGVTVKVYLESHQRPPTVITNRPVVVGEGQNVSISREQLEVFHEDSLPSEITFVVRRPPSLGFLHKSLPNSRRQHHSKPGKQQNFYQNLPEQETTTFTQEDLNQGKVFYHQKAAGSTNDSVLLEATNGVTKVGPIRLEIDVVPVLLPLQVSDLTLDEGSSLSLTSDIIKVKSHHFSGMNFLYQVIVPPRHGHLEHSRIPGMPITAFTHTEVEREYISYIHDGSDTQADSFTVVANQTEIRKQSQPCVVHVNITPVNDEMPVVAANKGLKVWVGSVTEITVQELSAEDPDTPAEGLEFVVTPPSNGHLALKSAPSRHILNFTQHHVESRQLLFVHSGALSGGFHFQVNDGVNFAPREIFSTTAQSLVLTLQTNRPLEVYPGSITPISSWHLQAVTNDFNGIRRNQSVVFTVTSPPKLGRLVRRLPDNSTQNVSMFTQSMVNHGVILYDQKKPESVGWSAADSFSFMVSSPPTVLPPHTFTILISYQANEHQNSLPQRTRLLTNAGAVVPEGGRVVIDGSKLDASNLLQEIPESHRKSHHIQYRLVSLPQYGTLWVRAKSLSRNQPDFSQADVSRFGITYAHDDSETMSDSFTFLAWAAPSSLSSSPPSSSAFSSDSSPRSSMYSASSASLSSFDVAPPPNGVVEKFNITVMPVNDQPPLVRSRTPSMKVVVGERVILGPENLQVEDHDTPPEELHYLVISKPNNGYLTLGERPEPVTSFTQYDINHGRLHFTQQGEPSTGVFYFNITDGHHRPLYRLFHLEVVKPSVSMVNNTGLSLVQGRTAVVLTTNQLAAQTNGQVPASITYTVTAHPCHGRIAINDQEVATFGHQDLQYGRVVYHMTDLSESEDSFQVMASASSPGVDYGNVTEQTVNVTVRPLIHLREPVRVPSGITVKLGKAMIDASELARISRANPVFEVLSPPKHGKLVKMTYDPSQASEVLRSFTFRDVVQGRVAIKETLSDGDGDLRGNESAPATARGHAPATPLNDSFVFLLKAGNVQPAKGELHFTILPHHQMHHGPSSSRKTPVATTQTPTRNATLSKGGKGSGHGRPGPRAGTGAGSPPHILSNKNHNKTQHRTKAHGRWGNHTHSGSHGGRPGGGAGEGHGDAAQANAPVSDKHEPATPPDPVYVEVRPRPASDPLLIILPLLACLLLIVILVVLILVFRHRKEKRARRQLLQQLGAITLPGGESPIMGQAEHSAAMPSVVVTPLGPRSCPVSPRRPVHPRRRSLAPGMTYWGPFEDVGANDIDGNIRADNIERGRVTCRDAGGPAGYKTSVRSRSPTPTLKLKQYWV